jgi:hypothetical protein
MPTLEAKCPSGCGRKVSTGKLMCGPCWREVPKDIQVDVYRTWRAYRRAAENGADDFDVRGQEYADARNAALGCIR